MAQDGRGMMREKPKPARKQEQPEVKGIEPKRISETKGDEIPVYAKHGVLVLGPDPLERDDKGNYVNKVLTLFPLDGVVVTAGKIHAFQRDNYRTYIKNQREMPLSPIELHDISSQAVSGFTRGDKFYIRVDDPTPQGLRNAEEAVRLLENLVEPTSIKFTKIRDETVRDEFKRRGKYHLVAPEVMTDESIREYIDNAYVKVGTNNRYYHHDMGGRLLTYAEFERISKETGNRDVFLGRIREVVELNANKKSHSKGEVELYEVDGSKFSIEKDVREFYEKAKAIRPRKWDTTDVRTDFERLLSKFKKATKPESWEDEINNASWRNRMFANLKGMPAEAYETMRLTPALFMHVEWQPGAEIKDGALSFDPTAKTVTKELIKHFHERFKDMEYINVGRIKHKMVGARETRRPGREVYLIMLKRKGDEEERAFEVREHKLDVRSVINGFIKEGKITEDNIRDNTKAYQECRREAQKRSLEYSNYVNNRVIVNNMLGMETQTPHTLSLENGEEYFIWDFISGIETSSMPSIYFSNKKSSTQFASQMGDVASINMISGRTMFDMGTEVAMFSNKTVKRGDKPESIRISEPITTLEDVTTPFDDESNVGKYAQSLKRILAKAQDEGLHGKALQDIKDAFYSSFESTYDRTRGRYLENKDGWRSLFRNEPVDEHMVHQKWLKALDRLEACDNPKTITNAIEAELKEIEGIRTLGYGEGYKTEKIEGGYGITVKVMNEKGLHSVPAMYLAKAITYRKMQAKKEGETLDVQLLGRGGEFGPADSSIHVITSEPAKGTDLHFHATCKNEMFAEQVLIDVGYMIGRGFYEGKERKFDISRLERELGYPPGTLRK